MTTRISPQTTRDALNLVDELCRRYRIAALEGFLESCRNFAEEQTLNIAILGRFKTGKSSFLNQLLGWPILPVSQDFRNRLSERTLDALGVPLRTTELDLRPEEPSAPDVRVAQIFDHHWELLSFLVPMGLVQGVVHRHFAGKVADGVFMNLSRLASQWEGSVIASVNVLEREALPRLEALVATIETLLASAGQEAPQIRADLQRLEGLWDRASHDER